MRTVPAILLGLLLAGTGAMPAAGADPDTTPPTAPAELDASDLTCESVTLTWSAATDDVGVDAYDIYHDGQLVRSVPGTARTATLPVVGGATWGWYVNARDAAGNVSQRSDPVTVTPARPVPTRCAAPPP